MGCDANKAMDRGASPFYIVCQEGHVAVVRLLQKARGFDASGCTCKVYFSDSEFLTLLDKLGGGAEAHIELHT